MSPYCLRSSSAPLQAPLGTPVTPGNPSKYPKLFARRPTPARRRSITAGAPLGDHPRAPRLRLSAPPGLAHQPGILPPSPSPPSQPSRDGSADLSALANRVQNLARSISRTIPLRSANLPARPTTAPPPTSRVPLTARPIREEFPSLPRRRPLITRLADCYRPTYSSVVRRAAQAPNNACCLCPAHKQLIDRLQAIEELVLHLRPLAAVPGFPRPRAPSSARSTLPARLSSFIPAMDDPFQTSEPHSGSRNAPENAQATPDRPPPPPSPSPSPETSSQSASCPICPSQRGEIYGHLRKAHAAFPFLQSDFAPGTVDVCHLCGAVTRPGGQAMSVHKSTFCRGQSEEMRTRLAGITVRDRKGRGLPGTVTSQSPASSPLRKTSSAPAFSSPLRASSHTASASPARPSSSQPVPPATLMPPPSETAHGPVHNDFYADHLTLADLLPLPGINKHLHPKLVAPLAACVDRLAIAYANCPSRRALFHILAVIKVGLVPAIQQGHDAVFARLKAYPDVSIPELPLQGTEPGSKVRRAKALVEEGFISKAERALNDATGIADLNPATIDTLRLKHPPGEDNPFSMPLHASTPFPELPESSDILSALRSMDNGTSPGPSGWTVKLLAQATTAPGFVAFLTNLTAEMGSGTAPGRDLLCAARLTPLLKPLAPDAPPDAVPGIRPIAVGEIFYRLAMKSLFIANFKSDFLSPNQFGVGTQGGCHE